MSLRDPDREFDRTQLRASTCGRFVHRDYAAHFFRWGFAKRMITSTDEVLDVGCGQDLPLVMNLSHYQSFLPKRYVGVDLNQFREAQRGWATYHQEFDFTKRYKELCIGGPGFTVATCLEVIEHMRPPAGVRLLKGLHWCLKPGGRLLLSTPCYDGVHQAKNHLHEYTIPELQRAIIKAGFVVERRFGTFANERDIKRVASKGQLEVFAALKEFYDGDVMACFLAPLYPDAARNNLWVCRKP